MSALLRGERVGYAPALLTANRLPPRHPIWERRGVYLARFAGLAMVRWDDTGLVEPLPAAWVERAGAGPAERYGLPGADACTCCG